MEVRKWELGDDLLESDNLLDPVTFGDLILAVHCNCRTIDRKSVQKEMDEILEERMTDFRFLLKKNMDAIMAAAKKGRSGYEK